MARQKIRHWGPNKFVFIKGEPSADFRPGSYQPDGDGFWVSLSYLFGVQRNKKAAELAARRARRELNRPRFGVGSGRAGGGRGAVHARCHHIETVNHETKPINCPICYHRKLWRAWIRSDHGLLEYPHGFRTPWADWPKNQLFGTFLKKMTKFQRRHLRCNPREMCDLYRSLPTKYPDEFAALLERRDHADIVFDAYMRLHRDEDKGDYNLFLLVGPPFVYTSTHEIAIPTDSHTEPIPEIGPEYAVTHGVEIPTDSHTLPGGTSCDA